MAADTAIAFTLICAALLPVLWTRVTDNELLRKSFLVLSVGFVMISIYVIKSVISTSYPTIAGVLENAFLIFLVLLIVIGLLAAIDVAQGIVKYCSDVFDKGKAWRGEQRNQSNSQSY